MSMLKIFFELGFAIENTYEDLPCRHLQQNLIYLDPRTQLCLVHPPSKEAPDPTMYLLPLHRIHQKTILEVYPSGERERRRRRRKEGQ